MSVSDAVASHAQATAIGVTLAISTVGAWLYAQTEVVDSTSELIGAGGLVVLVIVMGRVVWSLAQIAAGKTDGSTEQLIAELRRDRDYWRDRALKGDDNG